MSFCSPPTLGTHNSHQAFSFVKTSEYQASLVFYLVVALILHWINSFFMIQDQPTGSD